MLDAASEYGRAFPMMMTAAGTISAAKVFVMGVGVAGLQLTLLGGLLLDRHVSLKSRFFPSFDTLVCRRLGPL